MMRIKEWFFEICETHKKYVYIDDNGEASIIKIDGDTITKIPAKPQSRSKGEETK